MTLNVLPSSPSSSARSPASGIRDKIAASNKKSVWMRASFRSAPGEHRALHVVEEHAPSVRDLFRHYLEIGSVVRLKVALDNENVRLPIRIDGNGKTTGGGLISLGHLYKILSKPIYLGRPREGRDHRGTAVW